jgi:alpha-mannosidase
MAAIETDQLPNFYLDGQAIVLEDLIEIEPGLIEPIKKAMKRGRLSAGPWYVLPDQSLVGGESLVRNLKLGIEITRRFGPPTMTGYNPDTFCHVQDLPRILKGFDIDTALVLRGVPPLPDTNVFWWQSPDGSRVLTYWLNKGLSHPIFHKTTNEQEIAKDLLGRWDLEAADDNKAPMLYSAGGEGMQPPGDIQAKIQKLNAILPKRCKAKVISMEEFLVDLKRWAKDKSLPVISGDLRDNRSISERFPAYILDGVSSTRLYLKRDNALAEHRLARITEPLLALLHAAGAMTYPENELIHVWKLLIQNHPHDSICGCSIDPVHQEMRTRTQQFNTFLDGVDLLTAERVKEWSGEIEEIHSTKRAEQALPAQAGPQPIDPDNDNDRLLVFNTSTYPQQMPLRMTWYSQPTAAVSLSPEHVQIESEVVETNHLYHSGGGFYYKPVRRIDGWIWPDAEIPAMGVSQIQWRGLSDKSSHTGPDYKKQKEQVIPNAQTHKAQNSVSIDNGLIRATIDPHGDLEVTSFADEEKQEINVGHHLVDVGDGGDTYNFDPLVNDSELRAKLVKVSEGKKGPLVSSMILEYSLAIPESLDTDSLDPEKLDKGRANKSVEHKIRTEVSLKKGVPILFFDTTFENHSRDHRLSVRFSTGQPLKESWSECHFSVAKHPVHTDKPKLPVPVGHEILPESEFSQRFFIAAGQLYLNRGLPEYRMGTDFVEITLVRAVSYLSRGRLRTRGGGAGPWEPTPEANCFGINRCEYAWSFLTGTEAEEEGDQQIVEAYRLADLFEGRLVPFPVGKFTKHAQQSLVEISNPALYITATYIDRGKLYLRLLNVTSSTQQASIAFKLPARSAAKTNLLGDEDTPLPLKNGSSGAKALQLSLQPNELVTIAVELD